MNVTSSFRLTGTTSPHQVDIPVARAALCGGFNPPPTKHLTIPRLVSASVQKFDRIGSVRALQPPVAIMSRLVPVSLWVSHPSWVLLPDGWGSNAPSRPKADIGYPEDGAGLKDQRLIRSFGVAISKIA